MMSQQAWVRCTYLRVESNSSHTHADALGARTHYTAATNPLDLERARKVRVNEHWAVKKFVWVAPPLPEAILTPVGVR